MLEDNEIQELLASARELSALCSQNGWIDTDTLVYEIKQKTADSLILSVNFEEILMEGSGCVADRVRCYGQVELSLDDGQQAVIKRVSR